MESKDTIVFDETLTGPVSLGVVWLDQSSETKLVGVEGQRIRISVAAARRPVEGRGEVPIISVKVETVPAE